MICAILALAIGSGASTLQVEPQEKTQVFTLQNLRPSKFVEMVGFTIKSQEGKVSGGPSSLPGIRLLTANDDLLTVTAVGTAEGIQETRGFLSMFDIVPPTVELDIMLSRLTVKPYGSKKEEMVSTHTGRITSNEPFTISSRIDNISFECKVIARVNGDESCSLFVLDCSIQNHTSGRRNSISFRMNRRLKANDLPLKFGLFDTAKGEKFDNTTEPRFPVTGTNYSVYFVRIKPTVDPRQ